MSSPGDLPNPGIKPRSPALQADSLPTELPGSPNKTVAIHVLGRSAVSEGPGEPCLDPTLEGKELEAGKSRGVCPCDSGQPGRSSQTPSLYWG